VTSERRFLEAPHVTLLALSFPVMLSMIVEPLAGLVDTAFVERLGASQAAALGSATAVLSSVLWVFNFLGIGTQTQVAQSWGADEAESQRQAVSIALVISVALGVAVGSILWFSADALATWMSPDTLVQKSTAVYLRIRALGAPAGLVLLTCFGALRGRTNMRTPLRIAVVATVVNMVLDPILIFGAGPIAPLGIAGAAWATIASQLIGALAAIYAVARFHELERPRSWSGAAALFVIGRDMVTRTGALLLFMLIATRVALSMGPDAGAAHQAIRQVWLLSAFLLDAFAASSHSLVGVFVGGEQKDTARKVARVATLWALGTGMGLTLALFALEHVVAVLLVPASSRDMFHPAWIVCALTMPLNALAFVSDGIHKGAADFSFLRNAMLVSTGAGLLALSAIGPHGTLVEVWWATALWIALRTALGIFRIWPGLGHAPLRA
jgi:MATE family multidrug resistance protein